ncbi:MAG: GTPase Era [Bacteroidota bacterium]|nr:GTPase Era [Bacteroidota bacterium]MED5269675.1 GTPase Era [Bacteroidota bacterium]|tara:strand:- start:872 stop:1762 length:891 start_codon:yes stop_codon:yes gene_type:complete
MRKKNHKSGFVSIIGRPNVGKSTLINALMEDKLSIITSKAQTTRHRIRGIINGDDYQIVISDTPGILDPNYQLQEVMMKFINETLIDSDVLVFIDEVGSKDFNNDSLIKKINKLKIPKMVLLNKIDLFNQDKLDSSLSYWQKIFPEIKIYPISAKEGFFVNELKEIFINSIPESPPFFPKDQFTDKSERFFVNESLREQILLNYDKEIPYSVEVITEEFKETNKIIKIRSVIFTERDSQKKILIGHKGAALKKVASNARKNLEKFFNKKIFLEVYIKVKKNWRNDKLSLKRFGYNL